MKHTFNIDRIYHQLMKPKGIPVSKLPFVVSRLYEQGFIELYSEPDLETERYSETDKLTGHTNKKELFKLLEKIKNETL